jgi:radical SAM/Cys-rich protein
VLQINVGKLCNQTCRHCHVDAGPDRREVMPADVVDACLRALESTPIPTLDITGGAPELHPQFRDIVRRGREMGRRVMDRCNLTILLLPAYADLPEFFARWGVEVVASLPSPNHRQTDAQRGDGVFERSIAALRRLNAIGYGRDPKLVLNLVTNPVGAFLPGNQAALEADWKRELRRRFGIEFDHLFTIANMPISRYLEFLVDSGNLQGYMERLVNLYNPAAAAGVMCRNTLSVGWNGTIYDCDFNQMLELPVSPAAPRTIFEFDLESLSRRSIEVGPHCFGCTAGEGSSCGGATA